MSTLSITLNYVSGSTNGSINSGGVPNNFPDYKALTINAVVNGGSQLYSYTWTSTATGFIPPGNIASLTFSSPINHNNNGTYTFTVTDQATNTTSSASFALTFYAALNVTLSATLGGTPITNFTIGNVDQQLVVNATTNGGDNSSTNYTWTDPNGVVVSTTSSVSPLQTGSYSLSVYKSSDPLSQIVNNFNVDTSFAPNVSIKLNNQSTSNSSIEVVDSIFNIIANVELPNYPYSNVNVVLQSGSTILFQGLVALKNSGATVTFVNFKPLNFPTTLSLSLYSASGFLMYTKTITIQSNTADKRLLNVLVFSDLLFRQFSKLLPQNMIPRF